MIRFTKRAGGRVAPEVGSQVWSLMAPARPIDVKFTTVANERNVDVQAGKAKHSVHTISMAPRARPCVKFRSMCVSRISKRGQKRSALYKGFLIAAITTRRLKHGLLQPILRPAPIF